MADEADSGIDKLRVLAEVEAASRAAPPPASGSEPQIFGTRSDTEGQAVADLRVERVERVEPLKPASRRPTPAPRDPLPPRVRAAVFVMAGVGLLWLVVGLAGRQALASVLGLLFSGGALYFTLARLLSKKP